MGVTAVHQVVAGCAPRDAISQHVLAARDLYRSWGLRSELYAQNFHPALADRVRPAEQMPATQPADELIIVHYSIDSPAFERAVATGGRMAMHYHNITPAEMLWRHAPAVARECARGRARLGDLAGGVEVSLLTMHRSAPNNRCITNQSTIRPRQRWSCCQNAWRMNSSVTISGLTRLTQA